VTGAGEVILDTNSKLIPIKEDVYSLGITPQGISLWGVFAYTGKSGSEYYEYSSFKYWIEGEVETLPDNVKVKRLCPDPDFFTNAVDVVLPQQLVDKTRMPVISVSVSKAYGNSNNFCYFGKDTLQANAWKFGVSAAITAVNIAATIFTGGLWLAVAEFAMGMAESWAYAQIDAQFYWPNNPSLPS